MLRSAHRLLTLLDLHVRPSRLLLSSNFLRQSQIPETSPVTAVQRIMSDPQDPGPDPGLFRPPPAARGMTELDREVFTQTVWVPALRVPTALVNKALKSLKKVTLQRPGLKRVADDTSKDDKGEGGAGAGAGAHRLVLLDPQLVSSSCSFGPAEASALKALGVCADLRRYELRLTYEQLKSEEVLRSVLPEGQDVTSGFSRVGHIAHVNLRDHQLPYKQLIGQVIMDKNPGVTCVVNKTNTIDSTYRNFQMEVLAGESNMVVKVKENGITYEFDFSRVYWNPRLSTEHERLAALLRPGDVVVDVFAGVGPFSVPAARSRRCLVLANDLNPEAHRWLRHNAKINKVESKIELFNLDGREFIRGPVRKRLPALVRGQGGVHVIMNLPALAPEFLDAFRGLLGHDAPVDDGAPKNVPDDDSDHKNAPDDKNGAPENAPKLPQVHCYGFWKAGDPRGDVVRRAEASLGVSLEGRCSVHMVRNVAPNKEMMCVSFTMPREVLYGCCRERDAAEEPSPKRQRCEETL